MEEAIRQLSHLIKGSSKIVFLGGAGVSTASGIPDFRSEGGIYRTRQIYGYPPETILSRSFFVSHPSVFFDFYRKEIVHESAQANGAHKALVTLEEAGRLKAIVTQNIDGLHQKAGSRHVLELHGSIERNYCMACHKTYDLAYVMSCQDVPRCQVCGNVVRPDVVLYEEGLKEEILKASIEAIEQAHVLIVGGTSLNVYPAAGLLRYYHGKALVLINLGETPYDQEVDLLIKGDLTSVLSQAVNQLPKL